MDKLSTKSRDNISDTESGRNVQRYIRLTYLIPELLRLVDEERIAFTPAVEISYLSEYEQRTLLDQIEFTDATPSLSQAQRLRKFSQQGRYSTDVVFAVLCEEKPNSKRTGSIYGGGYTQIFSEKLHQIRYAKDNYFTS